MGNNKESFSIEPHGKQHGAGFGSLVGLTSVTTGAADAS